MSIFKKTVEDASKEAGTVIGNVMSSNVQNGTDAAVEGMSFFRQKAFDTRNAGFDQSKGNLFEYIEAAKFNRSAANAGKSARAIVTDITDPHAEADILIKDNGKIAKEIQAKFIKTSKDGRDISAATSVRDQTGANNKGWGQYDGMDRLIRKQENYNSEGSLLDEAKKLSKARADSNGIYSEFYRDVNEHLTDETQYDGVSSGGTTYEEVQAAHDNPEVYAKQFEKKQVAVEMKATAKNMAEASFVTTGIISGISNMVSVFRDEKTLAEAGVYALINYPQCPNDSSHTRRKFLNRGSSGHLAYCATCGATLIALTDHIWSVETPTCEIGKYCILCNYSVPGQEKLGHDVYPVASDEYYAVNSDVHGHVCMRTECDYNPEHDF